MDYECSVDPFVISDDCIMQFVNFYHETYLKRWLGITKGKVKDIGTITYIKYRNIARNTADQKKYKFEQAFLIPILNNIIQVFYSSSTQISHVPCVHFNIVCKLFRQTFVCWSSSSTDSSKVLSLESYHCFCIRYITN